MRKNLKTIVVIPAYNEEKMIGNVIDDLKKKGFKEILVIDDGSTDSTKKTAENKKVKVYSHVINLGLGAALNTGISAALMNGADIIVTCDADGQHDAKDVKKIAEELKEKKLDVVIGSRMSNKEDMPFSRKMLNKGASIFTKILFGIYVTDTQSGLRAFSRNASEKIEIKTNKMEVSSEIIKEIGRNKLSFEEIPIRAIYTDYSLSKGQKSTNLFKVVYKLFLRKVMK